MSLRYVTKRLDHYEIREAALEIESFIDDLSRWYIRRSRRRLQRPENKKDYEAASATWVSPCCPSCKSWRRSRRSFRKRSMAARRQ